jgi:hypothetical protein
VIENGHAGFGRGTPEKGRKAPRPRPTSAVQDREWGPAFIKIGSYLPYPVRVCLNAHECAKQQARRQGLAFESLDNGFRWCANPARLQRICDRLGPTDVQPFFDRWMRRLPWPLTTADRAAGHGHRLTIWQLEVSLTLVFDAPRYGRQFFETLIGDNLDLGRPDRVNLLFPTRMTRRTPRLGAAITRGWSPLASRPVCTSATNTPTSSSISKSSMPCALKLRSITPETSSRPRRSQRSGTCAASANRSTPACSTPNA